MSNSKIPTRAELSILSDGLSRIGQVEGGPSKFDSREGDALKRAVGSLYDYCASIANGSNFWNWGLHDAKTHSAIRTRLGNYDQTVSDGFSEQLYYYTFHALPLDHLQNLKVLEIGCGLGAGLNFLSRLTDGAEFSGVDICESAVDKAKSLYERGNIRFQTGDAENLPFDDNQFDIVLNIESCHNYPNVDRFIAEGSRVLKPGGHFAVVDFFSPARFDDFMAIVLAEKTGLDLVHNEDVSDLVRESIRSRLKPGSFAMKHFEETMAPGQIKRIMLKKLYHVALGCEFVDQKSDFLSETAYRLMVPAAKRFTGDKYILHTSRKN